MFFKRFFLLVCVISLLLCEKNTKLSVQLDLVSGFNEIEISFDNIQRSFSVIIPDDYEADKAYPLVFYFHGLYGTKADGENILSSIIEHNDFIGISPQGYLDSWNSGLGGVPSEENDVGFVIEIINILKDNLLIDSDRIYTMGYSNGGQMSNDLALKTNYFAAIASLSSIFPSELIMPELVHKISVFQLHGELDAVVPYNGGQSSVLPIVFQSVDETINYWLDLNNLDHAPTIHNPETDCFIYSYQDVENPHEVRLCKLLGIAHQIGMHNYVSSMQAYNDIWSFFKQHPKSSN